ncbi:MAG: hypothetical protein PVH46_05345 [Granulosicoccaceae bacterium]
MSLSAPVEFDIQDHGKELLLEHYISYTGDDIAIVMTHTRQHRYKYTSQTTARRKPWLR